MYYGHSLHWVALHHILFGQLQQHRVVEELVDTDILTQTLQQRTTSIVIHQDLQFIRHLYVKDGDLHVLLYYLTYQSTWLNIIIAKWLK